MSIKEKYGNYSQKVNPFVKPDTVIVRPRYMNDIEKKKTRVKNGTVLVKNGTRFVKKIPKTVMHPMAYKNIRQDRYQIRTQVNNSVHLDKIQTTKRVANPEYIKGIQTKSLSKSTSKMSLSGTIKDSFGSPLIGANLIDLNDKYNGASTDFDGNFLFSAEPEHKIKVSHMGFTSKEFFASELPTNIVLSESVENLDEVYLGTVSTKKDNTIWIVLGVVVAIIGLFKK